MRLGLIARADNSGLGIQTWEFYKHLQPDKTLVMDISSLNNNKVFLDRYPGAQIVNGILRAPDIDEFLKDLDVVFVAEAPYNYHLYARARELGVKTAVQYNYEFFDWFANPHYPKPDMLIAPSMWHCNDVHDWVLHTNKIEGINISHVYLHCPVNRKALPYRQTDKARVFLHVAGRSAAHDRNGTRTVIEASRYLQTDAQILIHFQGEQGLAHQTTMTVADYEKHAQLHGDRARLSIDKWDHENYAEVYELGDVMLLPRRYGGNCLPMNEALSVGMPVIMTDISPNKDFLPPNWLVPAKKIGQFKPRTTIDIYGAKAEQLARRIDRFYNMSEADFLIQNVRASNIAEGISWENMRWKYTAALEKLCI